MEEYMESELSGIFRVKLITKNIVSGSPGTQFMHMRVKKVKMLLPEFCSLKQCYHFGSI